MAKLTARLVQFLYPDDDLIAEISSSSNLSADSSKEVSNKRRVLADGSFRTTISHDLLRRIAVNAVFVDLSAFHVDVGGVASLLYEDKRT
jgi:hypothetical protein